MDVNVKCIQYVPKAPMATSKYVIWAVQYSRTFQWNRTILLHDSSSISLNNTIWFPWFHRTVWFGICELGSNLNIVSGLAILSAEILKPLKSRGSDRFENYPKRFQFDMFSHRFKIGWNQNWNRHNLNCNHLLPQIILFCLIVLLCKGIIQSYLRLLLYLKSNKY